CLTLVCSSKSRDMVRITADSNSAIPETIIIIINHYYCVPRCLSWFKRDPQLTFHIYREQEKHQVCLINKFDKRKAWILKLRIGKPVSKFMRVCSLHFAEEDYFYR
ncbi:hypothetical protein NQ318_016452, partial [Aromia moschata]